MPSAPRRFRDGHFASPDMYDGMRTAWWGRCSCGWRGRVRRGTGTKVRVAIAQAWQDIDEHGRAAHTGWWMDEPAAGQDGPEQLWLDMEGDE